ncbi:hypothetical protein AT175_18620 (plasmid) [Vibrio parahaemolyticus]|nr:hypothetical protein SZ12_11570 [Vibrio parahaemolyticus]KXG06871.1 hypothetical protein AT175_18620 [Vibrio parahaemolyticus]OQS66071.1 hypothetical protein EM68_005815 [Vibrio parahaemolyticus]
MSMKSVELKDYELSPNVRKFCFALLMFFVVVIEASIFGLNVPEKNQRYSAFCGSTRRATA